ARSRLVLLILLLACVGLGWQVWHLLGVASHDQAGMLVTLVASAWWAPALVDTNPALLDQDRFIAVLWLVLFSMPAWLALIAMPLSRAYARAVGWRQVGAARPWFDLLGLSLPITAGAGIASALLLLVSQWSALRSLHVLLWWCASVALWLAAAGLIGCGALIVIGLHKAPRALASARVV
ncbi:MAG: hypothetical protein M3N23_09795, partial [Pseudomonadota bacterium]|nr:hypothetical protein [Pseudomonadota bacterium]